MTVIHRYITVSFLKYFCFVLVLVVGIYLSVDFIGRIDDFIDSDRSASEAGLYFLLKIPLIISQITPLAVLLSVLIVFGLMNKNNEIVALKSGGISVFYLLMPVAVLGVMFSALLFVFSEAVVPITAARASAIEEDGGQSPAVASPRKNIWLRQKDRIVHIKHYHPAEDVLYGITVYDFDRSFNLSVRTDAVSAVYRDGGWVFMDCVRQRFKKDRDKDQAGQISDVEEIRSQRFRFDGFELKPEDFRRVARDAEEIGFSELKNYVNRTRAEGYDVTRYSVDLYAKTAFPAVCIIMSLMGSGLALRARAKDAMAVSFAYGIVTAFVYWSLYSFCLSLGYGEVLPAWAAAWSTNILSGLAAVVLLLSLE